MCFCRVAVLMADLPGDAQFRKCPEGGQLIRSEIPNRLEQADHAFLHDVLMVRADQKIRPRLGPHKVLIFVEQHFLRLIVAVAGQQRNLFIRLVCIAFLSLLVFRHSVLHRPFPCLYSFSIRCAVLWLPCTRRVSEANLKHECLG